MLSSVIYTCTTHFAVDAANKSPDRVGTVRLVGGPDGSAGILEMFIDDFWRSVCDLGWDSSDAAVVCRELGYPGVLVPADRISFSPGGGEIAGSYMACSGTEDLLSECSYSTNVSSCKHSTNDVAVVCQGQRTDMEN